MTEEQLWTDPMNDDQQKVLRSMSSDIIDELIKAFSEQGVKATKTSDADFTVKGMHFMVTDRISDAHNGVYYAVNDFNQMFELTDYKLHETVTSIINLIDNQVEVKKMSFSDMVKKQKNGILKGEFEEYLEDAGMDTGDNPRDRIKVGDIFVCTWGYSMLLTEWYEVVGLVGKKSVKVRPISRKRMPGGNDFQFDVMPNPGDYQTTSNGISEATCRVTEIYGHPCINTPFPPGHTAKLWDGQPKAEDHLD